MKEFAETMQVKHAKCGKMEKNAIPRKKCGKMRNKSFPQPLKNQHQKNFTLV